MYLGTKFHYRWRESIAIIIIPSANDYNATGIEISMFSVHVLCYLSLSYQREIFVLLYLLSSVVVTLRNAALYDISYIVISDRSSTR